jgi:multidrug efflux system membrane fusion protein
MSKSVFTCMPGGGRPRAHAGECVVVLTLASVLLVAGCSKKSPARQMPKGGNGPAVPVRIAAVEQKTTPIVRKIFGSVEAYANVEIKAQVTGVLMDVHFTEGQMVKKDDLLLSIDPRQPQAALKMAQANLEKDQAQLKNAQREAARQTELFQKGFTSQDEFDKATTAVETLQAAVGADRAAIEHAALQIEYCSIRSPVGGCTGYLYVHRGNLIKANDISIVSIRQMDPIYVSFRPPEQDLPMIRQQMATHELDVAVQPAGDTGEPIHGVLSFIDNTVDPVSRTIHLRATFANKDSRLWPGQYATVVLTMGQEPNSLVVPSEAIQPGQSGQFVYVIKADQTVEARPVTIKRPLENGTVVEGVQAGETVVTDGQLRLVPGARVQVKDTL